jgi:hypothetical protein
MKTIPAERVDQLWDRVNSATEAQTLELAKLMQERQPALMVYLLASEETMEGAGEEDAGWLLSLGGIVFSIMSGQSPDLPTATPEEIEAAEEANLAMLEQLNEGSEADWMTSIQKLMFNYNQAPLLGAVVEALMEGHEDAPELAPDTVGLGLLALKTVIDCLDR